MALAGRLMSEPSWRGKLQKTALCIMRPSNIRHLLLSRALFLGDFADIRVALDGCQARCLVLFTEFFNRVFSLFFRAARHLA